jgi:hypothetical protein
MMNYLLRRRKLGRTSCREVSRASTTGLRTFRNDGFECVIDTGKYKRGSLGHARDGSLPVRDVGYVFRYGCTTHVPAGKVVNSIDAIRKVNDKSAFRKLTADAGLAPRTWLTSQEVLDSGYLGKVVVRPSSHAQGRNLHVVERYDQLQSAFRQCPGGYASELIDKVAEYRVFVSQGRAVWVANKLPDDRSQVAWNVAQGGTFENVRWSQWPIEAVRVAIEAYNLSGLDFGGVDVMVDAEGRAYVLEINSAPSQTSPYRQTATAKAFDWIVLNGKDKIPLSDVGGYKKYIHPCMTEEANAARA